MERAFTPGTASGHLTAKIPTVELTQTVREALAHVLAGEWDSAECVWLVDREGRLCGAVSLEVLLRADATAVVGEIGEPPPAAVAADLHQEQVALHAIQYGQHAVPVIGARGRLLGAVLAGSLLRILRSEHVEDLHRLVGIAPERRGPLGRSEEPPARSAWHRLPWLLVGLAGSMVATLTMSSYETALEQQVALGFFVPGIVYLADAVGTQSETLAVRRLARPHPPLTALVARELGTGVLIGVVLAAITWLAVLLGFGQPRLAAAVSLAVLVSATVATVIGVSFPSLLARFGRDPALGSGPLATIVQDCLSILVYFGIATRMM
jgi:magnesium transporter